MQIIFPYPSSKKLSLSSLFILFAVVQVMATPPAAPAISSFSPSGGAVGTSVIISGSNFNATASSDIVFFGATMATVTSASTTSLTVTVPPGATYAPITVLNGSNHLIGYSPKPFIVTFSGSGGITTSTFASPQTFSTGNTPQFVAVADIDGDGKADIVVANQNDYTIGVFLNKSSSGSITSGSFAAEITFSTGSGSYPNSIAIGDLDGDGKLDVVTANLGNASLSVFHNTSSIGNISFAAHADLATGNADPQFVSIADFDGDGKPDMAVTNGGASNISVFHNTTPGGGTIAFAAHADFAVNSEPAGIAIGDFDGDGKPDIAATVGSTNYVSVLHNTSSGGSISFGAHADFSVGSGPGNLAVSDVDGDGKLDIVTSNGGDGSASILHNTSSGSISFGTHQDINVDEGDPNESFYTVVMNDLDGDGKPDMIVVDNNDALYLLRNTSSSGSPSFGSKVTVAVGTNSYALYGAAVGDFDGDGKPDIVANAQGDNLIDVLRNKSAGIIASPTTTSLSSNNNPSFSAAPNNSVVFTATVTHSGTPVTEGTVSFTSNGVAISGGTNVAVNSSGQATVNTSFSSTGSYTIVATFNGDVNYSSSTSNSLTQQVNLHPTSILSLVKTGSSPTNASSVQYTATFGASVTGLSTSNFSLTATGSISGASVASISGSGTTYTITVNTGGGTGNLSLNLANATGLTPGISNTLPYTGDTYAIDNTAPTLTSLIYQSNNARFNYAKVGDVVSLTFGADEALQTPTVTIGGHTITATNTGGNNYLASYTMTSGDTEGRVHFNLTITDLAGNQGVYDDIAAGDDIEFDMTPPTIVIGAPSLSQIGAGAGSVTYGVTYSDVNFNAATLSPSDITLNSTGTATGTVGVSNSGTTSTVTISDITGVGTLGISIGANTASDLAGNEAPAAGPSSTFNVVSTDASLSNLQVDAGTLTPGFINGISSYRLVVGSGTSSVTVTPASNDANATIAVNGSPVTSGSGDVISLTQVINNVSIVVTAQDGVTTKTYSLAIAQVSANSTNLITIRPSVGGLSPGMSPSVTSYTSSVSNLVTSMTVTPTTADPQATITVNGVAQAEGATSAPISLNVGTNAIAIQVTSASGGHHKTYTLTVTRAASSNALLSSLVPSSGVRTSGFSPLSNNLAVTVGNSTTSITLTPTTRDANATVTVNGVAVASGTPSLARRLRVGDNTITTVVTAQDMTTTNTYTMVVTRTASSDANLITIRPNHGTLSPAFSSAVTTYTSSVPNATTSITVAPGTEDANASLTVNQTPLPYGATSDPIPLIVGDNPIAIQVTAVDGTQKTYTLTVTRAAAFKNNTVYEPISVSNPTSHPQMMGEEINVHQGLSPNGDGVNDFLLIEGINNYPDNKLQIMNRSGTLVFEAKGYDNSTKVFDGHSNKNGDMQLPGTYFYSLDFTANGVTRHKTGFIVLKY